MNLKLNLKWLCEVRSSSILFSATSILLLFFLKLEGVHMVLLEDITYIHIRRFCTHKFDYNDYLTISKNKKFNQRSNTVVNLINL